MQGKSFVDATQNLLLNYRAGNYREITKTLMQNYRALGSRISLNVQFFYSHLDFFEVT